MKRKCFTLIEILGVVILIAILAGLGFAGYSYASNKSKESATEALITRLKSGFDMANTKVKFIPPAANYSEIIVDTQNQKITIGGKDYKPATSASASAKDRMEGEFYNNFIKTIQMDQMGRFLNADKQVIDGWGNPVYYRYPGKINKGGIDLISAGSDGGFGVDEADTPPDDVKKYIDGNDKICDDVGNF